MGNPTKELCHKLDEMGVEYETDILPNGECGVSWIDGNDIEWEAIQRGENFEIHALQLVTPEQAIAATVGRRDTMKLWPEWEQVLFANVSDEVAQDNLNECVHDLLDKAATMGVGTCHSTSKWTNVFKCSVCGFEYDFVTDPYQGPKFCPRCGRKVVVK